MHSLLLVISYDPICLIGIILERIKVIISSSHYPSLQLVFRVVLRQLYLRCNYHIMLLIPVPAAHITILTIQWVILIYSNHRCHIHRLCGIGLF